MDILGGERFNGKALELGPLMVRNSKGAPAPDLPGQQALYF